MGVFYYYWDEGNYMNGWVVGFLTIKEAEKHIKKNYPNLNGIEIEYLKDGEILDIYSGE